ncbi:MAG TPA: uroporphyrinogen decarboxylase family protein [bacterium]|nr:uroporphyrinogen decarboxylase family protein [bacterium]HPN43075.1 uroporphyrinogen decarboxylase family protein [bacterium]
MPEKDRSHKDRVNNAIHYQKPDRTPRDFAAVPEIWQKLAEYFGTDDRKEILKKLDVDCRIVYYDNFCHNPQVDESQVNLKSSQERASLSGMWRKIEPDGSSRDIWGAHRKRVQTPFGFLDEFASFPLETASSIDDLKKYHWPEPDWWDFSHLRDYINDLNDTALYNIRWRVGSFFETAWSLYNFEKFQLDLAMNPDMVVYVMERIAEVHYENLRRVLDIAEDLIDIVYFYDDVASQENLLISPAMYQEYIQPFHKKLIDIAAKYNKPVMMHCCGSIYTLIPTLIDMGLKILNPVQPSARNMNPERLAKEFGGQLAFHGGIDVQQFLPHASPQQVKENVQYIANVLGKNGGYIMAGSHHLQADIPLDNVLAMYGLK